MKYRLTVRTREHKVHSDVLDNIGTPDQAAELGKQIASCIEDGGVIVVNTGDDTHIVPADAIEAVSIEVVGS